MRKFITVRKIYVYNVEETIGTDRETIIAEWSYAPFGPHIKSINVKFVKYIRIGEAYLRYDEETVSAAKYFVEVKVANDKNRYSVTPLFDNYGDALKLYNSFINFLNGSNANDVMFAYNEFRYSEEKQHGSNN